MNFHTFKGRINISNQKFAAKKIESLSWYLEEIPAVSSGQGL